MKITDKTRTRVCHRLQTWLDTANARQRAEGRIWYPAANQFAQEISILYEVPMLKVVGVIAALSPAVRWDVNKRQAETLIRAHSEGGDLASVVLSTYGNQAEKARRILAIPDFAQAVVLDILGKRAYKTWAFFDNIMRPFTSRRVTVDQHIVQAADFEAEWTPGAKWCYYLFVEVIQDIARRSAYKPHEVQAVIWVTYKDITAPAVKKPEPAPF